MTVTDFNLQPWGTTTVVQLDQQFSYSLTFDLFNTTTVTPSQVKYDIVLSADGPDGKKFEVVGGTEKTHANMDTQSIAGQFFLRLVTKL